MTWKCTVCGDEVKDNEVGIHVMVKHYLGIEEDADYDPILEEYR